MRRKDHARGGAGSSDAPLCEPRSDSARRMRLQHQRFHCFLRTPTAAHAARRQRAGTGTDRIYAAPCVDRFATDFEAHKSPDLPGQTWAGYASYASASCRQLAAGRGTGGSQPVDANVVKMTFVVLGASWRASSCNDMFRARSWVMRCDGRRSVATPVDEAYAHNTVAHAHLYPCRGN